MEWVANELALFTYSLAAYFFVAWGWRALLPHRVQASLTNKKSENHDHALESIRGLLALFVVIAHSGMFYAFVTQAKWSGFMLLETRIARVAVELFFALSGFLFWKKLMTEEVVWTSLWIARARRILPLYYFAVLSLVGICFWKSGFHVERLWASRFAVFSWLSLTSMPDLCGIPHTKWILANTPWSLQKEFCLYFSLIFLTWFTRRNRVILLVLATLLLGWWLEQQGGAKAGGEISVLHAFLPFFTYFQAGIVAAWISGTTARPRLPQALLSAITVGALVATIISRVGNYWWGGYLVPVCLTLILLSIAWGATLFGVLTKQTSIALGRISYPIYLLHPLVMFLCLTALNGVFPLQNFPYITYRLLAPLLGIAILPVALLAHQWIERRFYARTYPAPFRLKSRLVPLLGSWTSR